MHLWRDRALANARSQPGPELPGRHVQVTEAELDALVYELYGLTEEEIAIVEGPIT